MRLKSLLSQNFFLFLFLIILTFLIFILDQSQVLHSLKKGVFSLMSPLIKVSDISSDRLTRPFQVIANFNKNEKELDLFRKKDLNLEELQSQIIELQKENDFLRQALNLAKKRHQAFTVANIIGHAEETDKIIFIDVGEKDKIHIGDIALLPNSFLVGKVIQVFGSLSQIMLLNSPNFSVAVRGQGTRTEGLIMGKYDHLEIEIMNYNAKPEIGETFITSGVDGVFPAGLIVGKLIRIIEKPAAIVKIGWIEPMTNLNNLEKIVILSNQ